MGILSLCFFPFLLLSPIAISADLWTPTTVPPFLHDVVPTCNVPPVASLGVCFPGPAYTCTPKWGYSFGVDVMKSSCFWQHSSCPAHSEQNPLLTSGSIACQCASEEFKLLSLYTWTRPLENDEYVREEVTYLIDSTNQVSFTQNIGFYRDFQESELSSYKCSCPWIKLNRPDTSLNGDDKFCSHFKCVGNSTCTCSFDTYGGIVKVAVNGQLVIPKCWGKTFAFRKRTTLEKTSMHSCDNCQIGCENFNVRINTFGDDIKSYRICRENMCHSDSHNSHLLEFPMTANMKSSTSPVLIDIWTGKHNDLYSTTVKCQSIRDCEFIDCHFCMEYLMNPPCYGWFMMVLILVGVIFISMILSVASIFLSALYYCLRFCFIFPLKLIYRKGSPLILNKLNLVKKYKDSVDEEMLIGTPGEKETSVLKPKKRLKMRFVVSIFFSLCIFGASGCSEVAIISTEQTTCAKISPTEEKCNLLSSMRVALSPVGQDTCIYLKNDKQEPLGSMVITTNSLNLICKKENLYFTGDFTINCESEKRCSGTSACPTNCGDSIYPGHMKMKNGTKGLHGCLESPGCINNGCFYCDDGCMFYKVSFSSHNAYEVYECSEWYYQAELNVKVISNLDTRSKLVKLESGRAKRVLNSTMFLVSVVPVVDKDLQDCFIDNEHGDSAHVSCNKKGQYIIGEVGETQCNTKEDVLASNCLFRNNLVSVLDQQVSVHCDSEMVSIKELFNQNRLPIHKEGLWIGKNMEQNQLVAKLHQHVVLETQINMNGIQMTHKYDKTKCYATFGTLTGCYSCASGANLTMTVHTDFGEANAFLICEKSNIHATIKMSKNPKDVNLKVGTSVSKIDENCKLYCPGGETNIGIKGVLYFTPNSVSLIHQSLNTIPESSNLKWPNLWNLFFNHWILWIIFVSVVVGGIGLCILIKIFRKKKEE